MLTGSPPSHHLPFRKPALSRCRRSGCAQRVSASQLGWRTDGFTPQSETETLGSALLFPEAEAGEDAWLFHEPAIPLAGRRVAGGSDRYSPRGNGMLSEKGRLSAVSMPAALPGQGRELLEVGWSGVALIGLRDDDKRQKESPPVESRGSEQTPLLSKLSLRGESRCGWICS